VYSVLKKIFLMRIISEERRRLAAPLNIRISGKSTHGFPAAPDGNAAEQMFPAIAKVIRNVCIEHTRNPGDLSDGGWTVDSLNIADCGSQLNLNNARVVIRQLNLQSGAKLSLNGARRIDQKCTLIPSAALESLKPLPPTCCAMPPQMPTC